MVKLESLYRRVILQIKLQNPRLKWKRQQFYRRINCNLELKFFDLRNQDNTSREHRRSSISDLDRTAQMVRLRDLCFFFVVYGVFLAGIAGIGN